MGITDVPNRIVLVACAIERQSPIASPKLAQ
jgi:hypothetical protein